MPLTELQKRVLRLLSEHRSEASHVAGATGIHMATTSPRRSADLDLFHDHEKAVADAFAIDRKALESDGLSVRVQFAQPGFIRAVLSDDAANELRIDWAHDSLWRFMPPVRLENVGYVLHPVDLAVNKVLALAGRDEPRDFVDIMYLHDKVLHLGALCWAACGKDPGLNPEMLLDLLGRKGKIRQAEIDRLDLAAPFDVAAQVQRYRRALKDGTNWSRTRAPNEAGCLYRRPDSALFFAPEGSDPYLVHRGGPGGVLPVFTDGKSLYDHPAERAGLEAFFEQTLRG